MKFSNLALTLLSLVSSSAAFSAETLNIPFRMNYTLSRKPLTTENIWKLDPGEINPHRDRWILKRDVYLAGVEPVAVGDSYAIRGAEIVADTVGYVRPSGSYFSTIESFPCKPADWFGTEEGTREAAEIAAKDWEHFLSEQKFQLELKFKNVRGEFPEVATKNARLIFTDWLARLDSEWRNHGLKKVRADEWAKYEAQAKAENICSAKKQAHAKRPGENWKNAMEPIIGGEKMGKVLAIAPAKRWGGLFSVRVNLKVAEKDLVGKFLIDSGAPTSVISPVFLQAQGVNPNWIEVPKTLPKRVYWSGGSGIGKVGEAAQVKVSGFPIDLHQFVIYETDFFGPPDSFSTCCDGILGSDFLRLFTVVLDPSIPNEVRLYPREGFQYDLKDHSWIEASTNSHGQIESGCTISPADSNSKVDSIQGIQWDTGNESALEFSTPLYRSLQKESRHWNLSCADIPIANSVLISPKEAEYQSADETLDTVQKPPAPGPASIGMEVMGRGQVTFDLGHGRVWFTNQGIKTPIVQNRSGLTLEYQYYNGERILRVLGIHGKSEASKLPKQGIQVGTLITRIDSKDISEMDQWEVEQRLSGVYGPQVQLEYHPSRKTEKTVPLQVRF